jgi:hypothetical protein
MPCSPLLLPGAIALVGNLSAANPSAPVGYVWKGGYASNSKNSDLNSNSVFTRRDRACGQPLGRQSQRACGLRLEGRVRQPRGLHDRGAGAAGHLTYHRTHQVIVTTYDERSDVCKLE